MRIASIRSSASATGFSSPAVSRLARYLSGMRSERTSGIRSSSTSISPFSAADWIGLSGGMYQTMGSVRYSGCSGKATFQSIAIFQTGDSLAASIHVVRHAVPARLDRRSPDRWGRGTGRAGPRTGPARSARSPPPRSGRRRTAARRDSGSARRRSRSRPSAAPPRCAGSRRCTSPICRTASCSRSSCTGSRTRTSASRGTSPDRSGRCRPPRACRSRPTGRPRRRTGSGSARTAAAGRTGRSARTARRSPSRPSRSSCRALRFANSPPRISSQFGPHSILRIRSPVICEIARAVGAASDSGALCR